MKRAVQYLSGLTTARRSSPHFSKAPISTKCRILLTGIATFTSGQRKLGGKIVFVKIRKNSDQDQRAPKFRFLITWLKKRALRMRSKRKKWTKWWAGFCTTDWERTCRSWRVWATNDSTTATIGSSKKCSTISTCLSDTFSINALTLLVNCRLNCKSVMFRLGRSSKLFSQFLFGLEYSISLSKNDRWRLLPVNL